MAEVKDAVKNAIESDFLSMDEILDARDVKYKVLEVPEWPNRAGEPGKICIGSLDSGELLDFVEKNEGPQRRTAGLRMLVKSLVDRPYDVETQEGGNRIGTEQHVEAFKKKNARVIERLIGEVLTLNGMNPKAQEEAKNASGEAPTVASPTVLH